MILKQKIKEIEVKEKAVSLSCDVCKEILILNDEQVQFKVDNYVHIRKSFGYGSFSDGDTYHADICDTCANKLFKNIWKLQNELSY